MLKGRDIPALQHKSPAQILAHLLINTITSVRPQTPKIIIHSAIVIEDNPSSGDAGSGAVAWVVSKVKLSEAWADSLPAASMDLAFTV